MANAASSDRLVLTIPPVTALRDRAGRPARLNAVEHTPSHLVQISIGRRSCVRRSRRREAVNEEYGQDEPAAPGEMEPHLPMRLNALVASLSPSARTVVFLHYVEGLTLVEIVTMTFIVPLEAENGPMRSGRRTGTCF